MAGNDLILLIGDNEDDVFILRSALKKAGLSHPLFVAENGEKALEYLEGRNDYADRASFPLPALVLLDLKLPRVMGLDVLKSVRENPALPPLIVAVLTSSDQESDIEHAYRLGANSYLVKPPRPEIMAGLLESLCDYWFRWNTPPGR